MLDNPRRGRQARNFTANVLKFLGLKSSSEQIFSENCRWVPLIFFKVAALPRISQSQNAHWTRRELINNANINNCKGLQTNMPRDVGSTRDLINKTEYLGKHMSCKADRTM